MAFAYTNSKGDTYYLHERNVVLKGSGKKQTIYFFSRKVGSGSLDNIPSGRQVLEAKRSGLPLLKKS